MKKYLLIVIGLLLTIPGVVNAASGSVSISSSGTGVVGNNLNVTVTVSSSKGLGSWEFAIDYDKSLLQLTSSSLESGGTKSTNSVTSPVKSKSYNLKFKVLKSGTAKISVYTSDAYAFDDLSRISLSNGSKTIVCKTQAEIEASYSDNAFLKSLSIEGVSITPEFDKNVFEYQAVVENDVEKVNISATKADSSASVSGAGEVALEEGNNKIEINVTAEKGNKLTYVINIERKELSPISVEGLDGYTYVRKAELLPNYETFTQSTINIDGNEIPALVSETIGLTLVAVKDGEGNVSTYVYDDGIKNKYIELKSSELIILPTELKKDDKFNMFKIKKIEFDGIELEGYVIDDNSTNIIIYARNIMTGDYDYYVYDINNKSFIKYDLDLSNIIKNKENIFKYIIFGQIGLIVILLFIVIFKKKPKKNKEVNILNEDKVKKEKTDKESKEKTTL